MSAIKAQKRAQHKGERKQRRRRKRVARKQQQARLIQRRQQQARLSQRRQRRIASRLASRSGDVRNEPVFSASNIDYEVSERTTATHAGGLGAMHLLAQQSGLDRKSVV